MAEVFSVPLILMVKWLRISKFLNLEMVHYWVLSGYANSESCHLTPVTNYFQYIKYAIFIGPQYSLSSPLQLGSDCQRMSPSATDEGWYSPKRPYSTLVKGCVMDLICFQQLFMSMIFFSV